MMNDKELAAKVIDLIGGEKNISSLTHCATRLRFVLKDDSKANINALDSLEGVLKAQNKGGQIQVIIGAKVDLVYEQVCKLAKISSMPNDTTVKKGNPLNQALETISGIFTPLLPALIGCGMVKGLALTLKSFGWMDSASGIYSILNMVGDLIFYFMPFFLAVSAARKFKTNEYIAIALAAALLHPTILDAAKAIATTGVKNIDFMGIPILLVNYSSSVIPIILAVWILSYFYKIVNKIVPEALRVLLTPMIVLLIMVPVTLIAVGPVGSYLGTWLTQGLDVLFSNFGIVASAIIGFFKPLMVMLGLHYSLMPMIIQQISEVGYSQLLAIFLATNIAQGGAALGVFFLTKSKTMKSAAASSSLVALFGITEPAIYGVNLKYKRPFFAGSAAAAIASVFFGIFNASGTAVAPPGLFTLSTYQADKFIYIIIGVVIAFVLGLVFTLLAGIKEDITHSERDKIEKNSMRDREISIMSPFKGEVKDLGAVDDPTFSQQLMGKGIAIIPSDGKVFAPFDGTVDVLFKTCHAIGLKADSGVEVLIHIGLDTVNLDGKYFTSHVKQSQNIKKGDLLIEFNVEAIKKEGYDVITPIIVTNSDSYLDILPVYIGIINENYELLKVVC